MTPQERAEFRDQRMRHLARVAERAGLPRDSFTNKSDLQARPGQYRRFTLGPVSRAATGGTTGVPLQVERSLANVVFEQATIDHVIAGYGIEAASARVAVFRGDNIKSPDDQSPPFWRDDGSNRRTFSSIHLNRKNAGAISTALARFQPDVLACYPSSLSLLLEYVKDGLVEVAPQIVVTSSEHVERFLFADVGSLLGCPLLDYYGQAERVCFASSDQLGRYRFRHDYGAVLLKKSDGDDRIFGTPFHNNRQLFYRYDTGDTTAGTSQLDEENLHLVELGVREFDGIGGRVGERMDLPDGRRIVGFNQIPRNVRGVDCVQFIRTGDWSIDVLVVKGPAYSSSSLEAITKNLKLKVPSDVERRFVFSDVPRRSQSGKALVYIDARTE
jgi:phenylacetate-CoA ligase